MNMICYDKFRKEKVPKGILCLNYIVVNETCSVQIPVPSMGGLGNQKADNAIHFLFLLAAELVPPVPFLRTKIIGPNHCSISS